MSESPPTGPDAARVADHVPTLYHCAVNQRNYADLQRWHADFEVKRAMVLSETQDPVERESLELIGAAMAKILERVRDLRASFSRLEEE